MISLAQSIPVPLIPTNPAAQIIMALAFLVGALGTLATVWLQFAARKQGAVTAEKVEKVRTTLVDTTTAQDKKLNDIADVADKTHTLVNANMGIALHLNMVTTSRLAQITKDAKDIEAAALAKQMYDEHQAKQAVVDAAAAQNKVAL